MGISWVAFQEFGDPQMEHLKTSCFFLVDDLRGFISFEIFSISIGDVGR